MPIKAVKQFTAWSFSRYNDWVKCPFYAARKHLDKLKEPEGPSLARGSAIHKLAEDYSCGRLPVLPIELKLFPDEFKLLKASKKRLMVEQQWAFTRKWTPTGWFDGDAWVRITIDAGLPDVAGKILQLIDYKTGKIYDHAKGQLSLYGIGGFLMMPKLQEVHGELWYLDQGEEVKVKYKRTQLPVLQAEWEKKVQPMLADTTFRPKPQDACRYCYLSKSKKGPCKF